MTTWTLTSHTPDKTQTIIGAAEDPEHAQRLLIAATQAAIERAAEHSRPRYTLHIDGQLTASCKPATTTSDCPTMPGQPNCSSN